MIFVKYGGSRTKARVFISIGSNLGERAVNCRKAIDLLGQTPAVIRIAAISSIYETEPWGVVEQCPFLNLVVEVVTGLEPEGLLKRLKQIEEELGRTDSGRWGPRPIDLDIIYYGNMVIDEAGLTIPHPRLYERGFVLVPLVELAPDFVDPVYNKTASELLGLLGKDGIINRLDAGGAA